MMVRMDRKSGERSEQNRTGVETIPKSPEACYSRMSGTR